MFCKPIEMLAERLVPYAMGHLDAMVKERREDSGAL